MGLDLVYEQGLHQWRMTWDGDYRLWYETLITECGMNDDMLVEYKVMLIPVLEEWWE